MLSTYNKVHELNTQTIDWQIYFQTTLCRQTHLQSSNRLDTKCTYV